MEFKEYLLNELYSIAQENGIENEINVAEYRSFKMPDNKEDLLFVIKPITGGYVGGVKTQPLQIFCYSQLNNMQSAYLLLDTFAKKHSQFQMVENYIDDEQNQHSDFIKMNFDTPVSMRNFIQSEEGYRASVYCFGTIIICPDIRDISKIEYYVRTEGSTDIYENIEFLDATLSYGAVLNTTKYAGQELSVSIKQEAGLTLSMTLVNKYNLFCGAVNNVAYGIVAGNTNFRFKITQTSGSIRYVDMKLENAICPSSKTAAPTLTLTFRK